MPKKSVQEIVQKEMPEFAEEVAGLSVEDLNGRLAQFAKDFEATEDAKDADEELVQAQEKSTAMAAPYRDAKKAIKLKSRYVIALIQEKGGK